MKSIGLCLIISFGWLVPQSFAQDSQKTEQVEQSTNYRGEELRIPTGEHCDNQIGWNFQSLYDGLRSDL